MEKKNFWERLKIAFLTLFSNKSLQGVYQEGIKAGKNEIYEDYKIIRAELKPFIEKLVDEEWREDKGVAIPGVIKQEVYQVPVTRVHDVLGGFINISEHPEVIPYDRYDTNIINYRQETIHRTFEYDARMARSLHYISIEASKNLANYLLLNGFIKYEKIATPGMGLDRIVFYINTVTKY